MILDGVCYSAIIQLCRVMLSRMKEPYRSQSFLDEYCLTGRVLSSLGVYRRSLCSPFIVTLLYNTLYASSFQGSRPSLWRGCINMTTIPESALQPCGRRMNTISFNSDWTKACSASKWPKSNPNSHAIAANVRILVTDGHEEKVKKKPIRLLVTLKTFPINYHVAQLAY